MVQQAQAADVAGSRSTGVGRRLRIGVVTAFPPGRNSLNEFGFHLVSNLVVNDEVDSIQVFADRTGEGKPELQKLPVDDERFRPIAAEPIWRFNDWRNLFRLARAIRRSNLDAVLFNLQFATFGDRKLAGGLGLLTPALVSALGVPTGVILHNLSDNVDLEKAGFTSSPVMARIIKTAGRLLTRALLRADYVSFTIPRYVEYVREEYGADNVLLAPHGAFGAITRPPFGPPAQGPRRILAFGKFGTYKTVDVLVEAFRILLAEGYADLELVIAGTDSPNSPGYLAGVAGQCTDLDNVVFTGYVAEEDVPGLFLGSTVTAFPYTSTTGSSGVLHQAGEYGRAAVLPAIGDFVDVIEEEGFIGEYFEPDDPVDLARAIARLVDDPELNRRQGERNYLAAAGIPMSDVVDWHLLHLRRLVNGRGPDG